ncbi:rod shape-determining protein MreD [Leuconostoc inhae]|uniref:rod shape-determining protein MreD n=1 Tax=Leuconostoc inhae TaxID=178001 RepID=UPI001C7D063A|nr:rod shape-determining protein MreD [Leuconostoc inhae]
MAFWQLTRLRVVYPVFLFFLLFVDGSVMAGMGGMLTAFPWHILPALTLVWLFYAVQFEVDNDMPFWLYVILIGILFDMYYTGIFGTYTLAFISAVAVMKQLHKILDERLLSGISIFLVGLIVYLIVTYVSGFIIGIANVSLVTFLAFEVLPTAILNIVLVTICYYPTWSLFQFLK